MSKKLLNLSPVFQEILPEYIDFVKEIFKSPIIVLFGSSVPGNNTSDLDICTIVDKYSKVQLQKIVDYTIEFHRRYSLKLDFDVPYESKVIYSKPEIRRALTGWQYGPDGNKFSIPAIIMNQGFLGSKEMKDRLLINILTTNSLILIGRDTDFQKYSEKAWKTLIVVLFSYTQNRFMNCDQLIKTMCQDPYTKEKTKHFLGYDYENAILIKKITVDLNRLIGKMRSQNEIIYDKNSLCIKPDLTKKYIIKSVLQKRRIM